MRKTGVTRMDNHFDNTVMKDLKDIQKHFKKRIK